MTPYDLIQRGWHLFPTAGKMPLVKWTIESSNDPLKIAAWEKQFPGCAWGNDCGKSGHAVLDIDSGKVKEASDNLFDLELTHGGLPRTLTVRTPSGGFHQIYQGAIKNSASSKLGAGLDTRGQGGFIVAPCSPGYDIIDDAPIAQVPEWLVDLVGRPAERKTHDTSIDYDKQSAVDKATDYLLAAEPAIEGLGGDLHTFKVACRLRDYGVSEQTALGLMLDLWNDRCSPPWEPEELGLKVSNAYRYAQEAPGNANPEIVFPEFIDSESAAKKRRFIDALELINRQIIVNYLVQNLIETPTTGLIFGDPGTKKSFIAIDLACCVATGTPWMGHFTSKGPVFYFAGEGKAGIPRRIKAWLKHHNLALEPGMLHVSDLRIEITPASAKALITEIRELTAQYGPPALIIIDTLARHLPSEADENSARDFGVFINAVDAMRDAFNCVALIIHHSGKQNKDSSRGTSAIKGALDFEFKTDGDKLECKKQKEGEEPAPLMYHLQPVDIGGVESAVLISDGFGQRIDPTKKLKARTLIALDVLKMEISANGGLAVARDVWQKAFYVQIKDELGRNGEPLSASAKNNAFKSAEADLLQQKFICVEEGRVALSTENDED